MTFGDVCGGECQWLTECRMAEGAVDTKMVSESAVLDAMLLRDCDFFVGRCVTIARAPLRLCRICCAP